MLSHMAQQEFTAFKLGKLQTLVHGAEVVLKKAQYQKTN